MKNAKEKVIKIAHNVSVDYCIAEEIKRLNDEHDIFTLSSCCGHGNGVSGYIIVSGDDINKMLKLEYEITNIKYFDNDIVTSDKLVLCAFKPKSRCECVRRWLDGN